jgi:hypothetical protein
MRVWLVSFGLLFVLAEVYQWIEQITLPLPVYMVGGVLLVIASNYDKGICWFLGRDPAIPDESPPLPPRSSPEKLLQQN